MCECTCMYQQVAWLPYWTERSVCAALHHHREMKLFRKISFGVLEIDCACALCSLLSAAQPCATAISWHCIIPSGTYIAWLKNCKRTSASNCLSCFCLLPIYPSWLRLPSSSLLPVGFIAHHHWVMLNCVIPCCLQGPSIACLSATYRTFTGTVGSSCL